MQNIGALQESLTVGSNQQTLKARPKGESSIASYKKAQSQKQHAYMSLHAMILTLLCKCQDLLAYLLIYILTYLQY